MNFDFSDIFKDKAIKLVSETAQEIGIDAFVVGGFVRDHILGRPNKDVDVLTLGAQSSERLALAVKSKLGKYSSMSIFKNFGTAQVKSHDVEIEFVTARKESYNRDSRNPKCEPGNLRDDLSRRDFSLNAMCVRLCDRNDETLDCGIGTGKKGELIDLFDGQRDLEWGILRTPLDPVVTFDDDPLRMMRCVRFASQLGMSPEENTFNAIRENADRIKIITHERIKDEFVKIMMSKRPSVGLYFMEESGLMEQVLPDVHALAGIETKNGRAHKDNFLHTMQVLDNVSEKSDNLFLRISALFHDIAKPQAKKFEQGRGWTFHNHEYLGGKMMPRIFKHLTLPLGMELEYTKKLVSLHMRPISLIEEGVTDSAIRRLLFEAGDDIDDLMILCDADITSNNVLKREKFHNNYKILREKMQEIEEKDHIRLFQPPVSGNDIMETFGIGQCREIGIIKEEIKNAILDGKIHNDREEALKMMFEIAERIGLKKV